MAIHTAFRSGSLILMWLLCFSHLNHLSGQTISLNLLGHEQTAVSEGVSWGVPFPKGAIQSNQTFQLNTSEHMALPLQTWPLAWWPDGSVKWMGCATVVPAGTSGSLTLQPLPSPSPSRRLDGNVLPTAGQVTVRKTSDGLLVNTGALECLVPENGLEIMKATGTEGRAIASSARLVCTLEETTTQQNHTTSVETKYTGRIDRVTLEQEGPVRAVVKLEGMHFDPSSGRSWLPFVVRLYFYTGEGSVKMVHSFVFDGNGDTDFIKSLGVEFDLPFREEDHNRHVRFAGNLTGESGFWIQPVRLMPGYRPSAGEEVTNRYEAHLAGQKMPDLAEFSERSRAAILTCPVWNDMRMVQTGPNGFSIDKRTQTASSWLHVTDGNRSAGGALLGDATGSLFGGIRDFWQKYPSSIQVQNAGSPQGTLSLWLWSPDAGPMDLRSYDTLAHDLSINYEDWKPGWATPEGIANTNEIYLRFFPDIPDNNHLLEVAKATESPLQLVCTPEYYHSVRAFGIWGLPDLSTPVNRAVERELERTISFYQKQIEQRYWFGFWNYGDIMHNYDFVRHEWRYDIGGWAWNNTELMPDMFLWYSFLRTGRADIWKMAEAMTRHSAEADVHHLGWFAPLGSRHNVTHWGDGAKQPRISHAGLKRYYYYLTTDERTGDLMRAQLPSDATYDAVKRNDTRNPARGTFISHGFGTDWCSYAINWMTEWERTGDIYWRDRIINGMKDLVALGQGGLLSSGGLYDPSTGRFMALKTSADSGEAPARGVTPVRGGALMPASAYVPGAEQPNSTELPADRQARGPGYFDMIFGAPEILSEMIDMIDYPPFWDAWQKVCASLANSSGNQMTGPRMAAWTFMMGKDPAMGQLAWKQLLDNTATDIAPASSLIPGTLNKNSSLLHPVEDPIFLGRSAGWQQHTPSSMQWALNALQVMEMAKEHQPTTIPNNFKNTLNY